MRTCRTRSWTLPCFLLVAVLPAAAQSRPQAPTAWQIEAAVGVARFAPDDLNARVAYDTAWLDYLRASQATQQHEGELGTLEDAVPVIVRITRRLGRHWFVGGGLSFLSSRQESSASASYRYTVVDPQAQEYQRQFAQFLEVAPLVLEVRDYLPHAIVGADVGLGRRLRVGGALAAGWAFATCMLTRSSTAQGGLYATNHRSNLEMRGTGNGLAAEARLTARLELMTRIGLLVEGGFAWHEVKDIGGSLDSTQRTQDGEATEVELDQAGHADGRWVNQPVTVQTSTGTWRGTVPSIGVQGSPFALDLSGWRFRAGISFGF